MTFYHATSRENWEKIQEEGVLFGRRYIVDKTGKKVIKEVNRCTYLAVELEDAVPFGDVLLQVEYDPFKDKGRRLHNNYIEGCWQIRVYEPIPLEDVKLIHIFS